MRGFHRLPADVASRRDISANAKLGYAYLSSRARMGLRWPTLAEVESDIGVARATAVRLLRELVGGGLAMKCGDHIALAAGSGSEPVHGLDSEPSNGSGSEPPTVQVLNSNGSGSEPPTVQVLNSTPSITENSDLQRVQIARAISGLLLFESEVRAATGVGPDVGGLREWWRRLRDDWCVKAGKSQVELDAEIRAFGAWLAKQPEAKRARMVTHMRFRDHLGRWVTGGKADGAGEARPMTGILDADETEAMMARKMRGGY